MLGGMQTLCKYVRIACLCVELLLQSEAGEEFLKQHGLVRKVAELFRDELDGVPPPLPSSSTGFHPTHSHPLQKSSARILAEDRVVELMAREYFTFLGTLS